MRACVRAAESVALPRARTVGSGFVRLGVRGYGYSGALVVVLHGGPGAPGAVRGVAEGLSDEFRVLEPLQRRHSGGSVLSVEGHVEDLAEVMPGPAAIVGHSWDAMLAL